MNQSTKTMRVIVSIGIASTMIGCAQLRETSRFEPTTPPSNKQTVRIDGKGVTLDPNAPGSQLSKTEWEQRIEGLLTSKRYQSARYLVSLYPEYWDKAFVSQDKIQFQPGIDCINSVRSSLRERNPNIEKQNRYEFAILAHELETIEVERRNRQLENAITHWEHVISQATFLLTCTGIIDPKFWELASQYRQVSQPWPTDTSKAWDTIVRSRLPLSDGELPPDAALWAMIGLARLDREEAQLALVAFKRADSFAQDTQSKAAIAIFEAKSLIRLGQTSAAASLLVPLATHIDTPVGTAATALLGTLRFSEGVSDQALILLRRAIDKGVHNWPGRDEARADLALVLLASGDEPEGLTMMKDVRDNFVKSNQRMQLIRSYENESKYWSSLGKLNEMAVAHKQIDYFEHQK